MKTSILIAAHNEGGNLINTVAAVINSIRDLDYEIIISDDTSSDNSVATVQSAYPQVKLTSTATRRGASPTKDAATKIATGDIFVFLDGHTNPTEGAIERLVEDIQLNAGRAIMVPAIAHLDEETWTNSSQLIGYGYGVDLPTMATSWLAKSQMLTRRVNNHTFFESPSLIGCCFAIHRDLYFELRGMDVDMLQWGVEDIDLGMKSWLFDAPVLIDAEVVIGHRFRASFDNYSVEHAHVLANEFRFARKHFSENTWQQWINNRRRAFSKEAWNAGWNLYEVNLASIESERDSLLERRTHDEFWYAERFNLEWPKADGSQLLMDLASTSAHAPMSQSQFLSDPSPMPSPGPSPTPSPTPTPSPSPTCPPDPGVGPGAISIEKSGNSEVVKIGGKAVQELVASILQTPTPGLCCDVQGEPTYDWSLGTTEFQTDTESDTWETAQGADVDLDPVNEPSTTLRANFSQPGAYRVEVSLTATWKGIHIGGDDPCCSGTDCGDVSATTTKMIEFAAVEGDIPTGGDGCSCSGNTCSANPIRYSTGEVQYAKTDLASNLFGEFWAHRRVVSNRFDDRENNGNGQNWAVTAWPEVRAIVLPTEAETLTIPNQLVFFRSTQDSIWFDYESTDTSSGNAVRLYRGRYGVRHRLLLDESTLVATLHESTGRTVTLRLSQQKEFSWQNDQTGQSGQKYLPAKWEFVEEMSPSGLRTYADGPHFSNGGGMTEIVREDTSGFAEVFAYEFDAAVATSGPSLLSLAEQEAPFIAPPQITSAIRKTRSTPTVAWTLHEKASYQYNGVDLTQVERFRYAPQASGADPNGWLSLEREAYDYYSNGPLAHLLKNVRKAKSIETSAGGQIYNDHHFIYDRANRVSEERIAGDTQSFVLDYEEGPVRLSLDGAANVNHNHWSRKTIHDAGDGSVETVFTNLMGQVLLRELKGIGWIKLEGYRYDANGQQISRIHSSALAAYDPSANDLAFTLRDDEGMIEHTEYLAGDTFAIGVVKSRSIQKGANGTPIKLRDFQHLARTVAGVTTYHVQSETTYPNEDGSHPATTTYELTFHPDSHVIATRKTNQPAVPAAENGDDLVHSSEEHFDSLGRLIWRKNERGIISRYEYAPVTSMLVRQIEDVDTTQLSGVPSGWSTAAGAGLHVITDTRYDEQQRPTQTLGPWHEAIVDEQTTSVRTAEWRVYLDDPAAAAFTGGPAPTGSSTPARAVRTLQGYIHLENGQYTAAVVNPISISISDIAGNLLDDIQAVLKENGETPLELKTTGIADEVAVVDWIRTLAGDSVAIPQADYVRFQTNQYTECCRLLSRRVYHNIPSSTSGLPVSHYGQTSLLYDAHKRPIGNISPGGTITRNVLDDRGRTIAVYIGTNATDATSADPTGGGHPDNNMVLVTEYEYGDNGCACGDNLTREIQHVDANTTRVTHFLYDWRDRRIATDGELEFYQKEYHDNLGRVVKTERYDTDETGNLLARNETLYDRRGRTYRTIQHGVDPATGTVGHSLVNNTWYDPAGNVIKSLPAGSKLFTKTTYDSLGRPTVRFVGYDLDETAYSEAGNVTDDTILEQSETVYDNASHIIESRQRQRYHNAPANQSGPLGDPNATPKARVSYEAQYADGLGRMLAMANHGTNGGTALNRSGTIPTRSDTILVTTVNYDSAGNQISRTDPADLTVALEHDDAGRPITQITNPQPAPSSSPSSSAGECEPSDDTNVTVRTAYNPDGNVISITAENSATGDQTTQYVYGTTLADSGIASSLLKRQEIYPDSIDASDGILFRYNRQQQVIQVTDQGGTVHAYDYDKLGRQTQDRVTTLGADVDGAVRRIATTYDVRGLREHLTSYDNATVGQGNIVNDVRFEYNAFGQLITDYQSHEDAVNTATTPKVQYTYADGPENTIRPTALIYPNGRVLHYDYGSSGDMNDAASRVASLIDDDGTTHLVDYSYLGRGGSAQSVHDPFGQGFVIADSPQPEVRWTMVDLTNTNDPDTGDIYSGFDRFRRVKDNRWYNYNASADVDRIQYGYNRAGNRIWRKNVVADARGKHFDELYGNDTIQRLKDLQRGTLDGSHTGVTDETYAECWSLDQTGNWQKYLRSDDGSGWDLNQSRTANTVNEITNISASAGPTWVTPTYSKKLFEKSSLVHCESGEHSSNLAEMHHRFSGIGSTLVIFAEAAVMVQPCKCSFDDPTFR